MSKPESGIRNTVLDTSDVATKALLVCGAVASLLFTAWIHRPWTGCTTSKTEEARITVTATCWHCGGLRECDCSTCRGECLACKARKDRVQ